MFIKNKLLNKHTINVGFFHGTDLHRYNKDLNYLNKLKIHLNYFSNILLIKYCNYSYVVSNSMIKYIPPIFIKKIKIIMLGINLTDINKIKRTKKNNKQLIFVNNNKRGIKNYELAKIFSKKNNFKLISVSGLSQMEFFKILKNSHGLIITSFNEGSPNVLKEAIALKSKIFTVDVGDCKSIIQKFGGYLIDYEGNLLREYKPDKNYKIKYLSIENTANQLIQDYKFFKLNDKR